MSKYFLVAAAALVIVPAAAQAQAADGGFNGAYAGVQAGWGKRSAEVDFGITGVRDFDESRSGVDYGAFVGYDAPIGTNLVWGVEGEIGFGGKTLRDTPLTGYTAEFDPKWNYAATARLGFLASDSVLFYGRAGYGAERVQTKFTSPVAAESFSENDWANGLVVGGGVEFALSPNFTVRGEYRYKDFDNSYNPQQLLVGAAFRF